MRGRTSGQTIGFDLASIGEIQFLRKVLCGLAAERPEVSLWMFHQQDTAEEFCRQVPELDGRLIHVPHRRLQERQFRGLDLYITTEQFAPGPVGVYTLTLFHGQPAKGVTFRLPDAPHFPARDALAINDGFFLYGPVQRQTLDEHLAIRGITLPSHVSLFDIGYSKSDDLLNGRYDRDSYLRRLGLDPARKTVLYAPAFNEGASLRENGVEILEALCSRSDWNVMAKLPIDCLQPVTDLHATGGIDWFAVIGRLEQGNPNFRLIREPEADPSLAASDVLVTCISSIGFEFLAMRRPVVFFDAPEYFQTYLPPMFPDFDTSAWGLRTGVNGGREFGPLVSRASDLPGVIDDVLARPDAYPFQKDQLPGRLLYNPGKGTEAALAQINALLKNRARSKRPATPAQAYLDFMCGHTPTKKRIAARMRQYLITKPKAALNRLLKPLGYTLAKIDNADGYIDAAVTVAEARKAGLSVCDYRESREDHPQKRGRRNRIISAMQNAGVFENAKTVCEIGAGTGMYLEKVAELAKPKAYEVYETHKGWVQFLQTEYGGRADFNLVCRPADGYSLSSTGDGTCDLVHAHGVFVYITMLHSLRYLKECVRVCKAGGHIVFDCYPDNVFASLDAAEGWISQGYFFPVVIPRALLDSFARENGLSLIANFPEIHGGGSVEYFIWRKDGVSA